MAWAVTSSFTQRFEEALSWFTAKVPVTPFEFLTLQAQCRRKAFTVAGVAQLSLVTDVYRGIEDALANGTPLEEFKANMLLKIGSVWGKKSSHRLDTIFRTNIQGAYSAGRYTQLTNPDVLLDRPFWMFDAVLDNNTTVTCRGLNGLIRAANDPIWQSNYPPRHFNCRSGIRNLTQAQAEARGIADQSPVVVADDGFGQFPDKRDWQPDPRVYPPVLWDAYKKKMGIRNTAKQAMSKQEAAQLVQAVRSLQSDLKTALENDQLAVAEQILDQMVMLRGQARVGKAPSQALDKINQQILIGRVAIRTYLKTSQATKPTLLTDIMHIADGGAKGSNQGGFYIGKDGIRRYVKVYSDPAQAHGEHLANTIYRDLGIGAPESVVFEDNGKTYYASTIIEGQTHGQKYKKWTAAQATKVLDGFSADVLVGNWDVVGLTRDNILISPQGNFFRIDNGGSFLMRAMNGRKPVDALEQISEWHGFIQQNPSYKALFAAKSPKASSYQPEQIGTAKLIKQIKAIAKLEKDNGGWRAYVERVIPNLDQADKDAIIKMLEARTAELNIKRAELEAQQKANRKAKVTAKNVATQQKTVLYVEDHKKAFEDAYKKQRADHAAAKDRTIQWARDAGLTDVEIQTLFDITLNWSKNGYGGAKWADDFMVAYSQALQGHYQNTQPANKEEAILRKLIATRAARMEKMTTFFGLPNATHWRITRGVKDNSRYLFTKDILTAWEDTTTDTVMVRMHPVASWTWNSKPSFGANNDFAVFFDLDVPIENIVGDQFTDDGGFVTEYPYEREVLLGSTRADEYIADKRLAVIRYRGQDYSYADKDAIIAIAKADGLL